MKPEFIVAVKEFKDYLTSKRFLLIFAVLVLMCIAAIISGISSYNSQVTAYNDQLSHPVSKTNSTFVMQPQMPSMLLIFRSFSSSFITVGWLLAIAIGFDLISKEKETGSLKLLLARPTFRDSIINGKIIGSASILIVSLAATFMIALAILLFANVVPAGDDLARLITFFVMIVLFCIAFLAIGIAASAVSKNSTIAVLLAIGFVVFSLLLPNFSSSVSDIVLGPAPAMTISAIDTSGSSNGGQDLIAYSGGNGTRSTIRMQINPEFTSYENTRNQITEAMDLLSPTSDLNGIASVVIDRQQSPVSNNAIGRFQFNGDTATPSLGSSLPSILPQILALLVMTIVGFAISYAKFTRMDVR